MTIVIIIVLVCVVIVVGGALIARQASQRRQFGPEYDRLVKEVGPQRARTEFTRRQRRVAELGIKPLSPEQLSAFTARLEAAQERFIDNPRQSAQAAADLVTAVAAEVGYPVDDRDQLLTDLSVNHGRHLVGYRRALGTTEQAENASTEDFRRALLDYRALFNDLTGTRTADGGQSRLPRSERTALNQPS